MKKKVVILLSDKRSGSTMLQEALCAHPKIQTVKYSPHTYLETHHWLKAAVILKKDRSLFSNSRVYKGYGSSKRAKIYLTDELIGNLPNFNLSLTDKEIIFKGWEKLCEKYAQPIFFEKSPQYLAEWASLSLLLEWIEQTEYKIKIIGLIRNPLSVQYSAFQLFRTKSNKRQFGWLNTYKNLLAFKNFINSEDIIFVKYENIVNEPESTLQKICSFIEIEYSNKMINHVHGNSKKKWNQDPYFTLQLDESVIQLAKHFGYSDQDLSNTILKKISIKDKFLWDANTILIKFKSTLYYKFFLPMKLKIKNRS